MEKQQVLEFWQRSEFLDFLGASVTEASAEKVEMELPYLERNTNTGLTMNAGVTSSLINLSARIVAELSFDCEEKCDLVVLSQEVQLLAASISIPVRAVATLLNRGKHLFFVSVDILKEDGSYIARGTVVVRASTGKVKVEIQPEPILPSSFIEGDWNPGGLGPMLEFQAFIGGTGQKIAHMQAGKVIALMPYVSQLGDGYGNHQDGAIASLLDTAGGLAAFTKMTGVPGQASTPGLHMNFMDVSQGETIVAFAENIWQRDEMSLNKIQVVGQETGRIIAVGEVVYRIVPR